MSQRIWRKNAINFQFAHFKVGEICGYGEKNE